MKNKEKELNQTEITDRDLEQVTGGARAELPERAKQLAEAGTFVEVITGGIRTEAAIDRAAAELAARKEEAPFAE